MTNANQDSAYIDVVLLCLQAIERIGYRMSDFSSLKIEALREHNLDVPRVSERHATFNQMDVVVIYDIRVMFIYSYYFLFVRLQNLLYDFTYVASGMQPILTQAIERLGYA